MNQVSKVRLRYLDFLLGTSGTGSGTTWSVSSVSLLLLADITGADPAGLISTGDKSEICAVKILYKFASPSSYSFTT